MDGVKEIINDYLYPKEEILASRIRKHLEVMAPEKMKKYEQDAKWNVLWRKIEEKERIFYFNLFYFNLLSSTINFIILLTKY